MLVEPYSVDNRMVAQCQSREIANILAQSESQVVTVALFLPFDCYERVAR
jgi:hypothetical protein